MSDVKANTLKNTLKCVLVLGVIAVVCVTLLAFANKFMQVEIVLDRATSDMINSIAPTGVDNAEAFEKGYITMVDLSKGNYSVKNIDDFNEKGSNKKDRAVRAVYVSKNTSGEVTLVVEAQDKGNDGAIVMLVAYDSESRISGVKVKSQLESYWDRIAGREAEILNAFVGLSGRIVSNQIATSTGATNSMTGIVSAVNIANEFVIALGGTQKFAADYLASVETEEERA